MKDVKDINDFFTEEEIKDTLEWLWNESPYAEPDEEDKSILDELLSTSL